MGRSLMWIRGWRGALLLGPAGLTGPQQADHPATHSSCFQDNHCLDPALEGLGGRPLGPLPQSSRGRGSPSDPGRGRRALICRGRDIQYWEAEDRLWSPSRFTHKGAPGLGATLEYRARSAATTSQGLGVPQHLLTVGRGNTTSFIPSSSPVLYAVPLRGWLRRGAGWVVPPAASCRGKLSG